MLGCQAVILLKPASLMDTFCSVTSMSISGDSPLWLEQYRCRPLWNGHQWCLLTRDILVNGLKGGWTTKTKQKKTKTTPPKETAQPQSCVLQYSSVSPVERNALSKQDRNRTYGFTRTSIHQLSCSNKYLISIKTHAFDPPATIPTTVTNQKRVIKEHQVVFKITL